MVSTSEIRALLDDGGTVRGPAGEKVGKVGDVYLDQGRPSWITVRTGRLGTGEHFVPLAGSEIRDGELRIDYDRRTVLAAPSLDAEALLSPRDEAELSAHYSLAVHSPDEPDVPAAPTRADGGPSAAAEPSPIPADGSSPAPADGSTPASPDPRRDRPRGGSGTGPVRR